MTCPEEVCLRTTALSVGEEEMLRKLLHNVAFSKLSSIEDIMELSKFAPRLFLVVSGCIGAGLTCNNVNLVHCIGTPAMNLNLIQEMGRCGRKRTGEHMSNIN